MKISKTIVGVTFRLSDIKTGELFETGGDYYIKTDGYPNAVNIETGGLFDFDSKSEVYPVTYNLEVNADE